MCIVCIELIKQQMTLDEAERNLGEMVSDKRETLKNAYHYYRLKVAIQKLDLDSIDKLIDEGLVDRQINSLD